MSIRRCMPQFLLICLGLVLALSVGCRKSTPMYNPGEQHIENSSLTLDKMTQIIKEAGAQRSWIIKVERPGYIIATQDVGKHLARVSITYTANTFTIAYLDSANLNSNDGNIHARYNTWVRNLEKDIKTRAYSL